MGRHKDPAVLALIDELKKKGESFGFEVDDEFKLLGRLYFVDLVWTPYKAKHEMFISFEVEKEDQRTLKNLDKIFDTPAPAVEKPYQHFIIIYNGKLSGGDKIIVDEKARSYNIHVFENMRNDTKEKERLDRELDQLKIAISGLIEKKGRIRPLETTQETILGLGKITPVLIIANQKYILNQVTMISGSQNIQEITAVIPHGLLFDSKKYKQLAIVAIPRKTYKLVIPNTAIALPIYMETKTNNTFLSISLEVCNAPFLVNCELVVGDGGTTEIEIDPKESDAVQLKEFEDFIKAVTQKKTIEIYDVEKLVFRAEELETSYTSNAAWYEEVCKLAEIQVATSVRIPAPKNLTLRGEDHNKIVTIEKIVRKGEFSADLREVTIQASKDLLLKLIETQKTRKGISNMKFSQAEKSETLLGQKIPLGRVMFELPEMIFKDSIDDIEQRIDKMEPNSADKIVLIPKSSGRCRVIYPQWKKAQKQQLTTPTS